MNLSVELKLTRVVRERLGRLHEGSRLGFQDTVHRLAGMRERRDVMVTVHRKIGEPRRGRGRLTASLVRGCSAQLKCENLEGVRISP